MNGSPRLERRSMLEGGKELDSRRRRPDGCQVSLFEGSAGMDWQEDEQKFEEKVEDSLGILLVLGTSRTLELRPSGVEDGSAWAQPHIWYTSYVWYISEGVGEDLLLCFTAQAIAGEVGSAPEDSSQPADKPAVRSSTEELAPAQPKSAAPDPGFTASSSMPPPDAPDPPAPPQAFVLAEPSADALGVLGIARTPDYSEDSGGYDVKGCGGGSADGHEKDGDIDDGHDYHHDAELGLVHNGSRNWKKNKRTATMHADAAATAGLGDHGIPLPINGGKKVRFKTEAEAAAAALSTSASAPPTPSFPPSPWVCNICDGKAFPSHQAYEDHRASKRHKRNARGSPEISPPVAGPAMMSPYMLPSTAAPVNMDNLPGVGAGCLN
ncbi:hypothetical protein AK812_SmicGene44545 [Symbiodinium microadriaticum]|uniref:Uncharacterized protein n=1 Tax=Symbiodinium microadriaticum TaxID=2951 RepID=A0A1Q9BYH5_SYMMI|nr:hypothetical protein AK812_SmicGene44545 [Symbiodinium microadriaticum]